MKKFFMCAVAVAATMSLTSCLSEEEVNLNKAGEEKGYINVNVSSDNKLVTRAVQNVADPSSWYVTITGTDSYSGQIGSATAGLAVKPFAPGTNYTASVSSHENLAAALALNDGFGAAYYAGSTDSPFAVETGKTATPTIACGKAKNAAISVSVSNTFTSISGASINSLKVSGSNSRVITFFDNNVSPVVDNLSKTAFFDAETVNYAIDYTINEKTKTYEGTLPLAAGTSNSLSITSNSNGSITLSISYDPELATGVDQTITIDAATGNASVTPAP